MGRQYKTPNEISLIVFGIEFSTLFKEARILDERISHKLDPNIRYPLVTWFMNVINDIYFNNLPKSQHSILESRINAQTDKLDNPITIDNQYKTGIDISYLGPTTKDESHHPWAWFERAQDELSGRTELKSNNYDSKFED